jgi:predicted dehydrogenase
VNLSRMLFGGEPVRVEGAVVRDGAAGDGVDILTTGLLEFDNGLASFGCSIRTEPDQRVDVYGSDGRISIGIPFNIPPDRPTQVFVTKGGDPPVAPATETLTFETKDPYAAEAERFADAVLDGLPTPVPPSDAVANLRVIERLFASADAGRLARV